MNFEKSNLKLWALVLLTTLTIPESTAQITNSWKSDSTGLFYYSLDTLIKRIKTTKQLDRILISMDDFPKNHESLWNTIAEVPITKLSEPLKHKFVTSKDLYILNVDLLVDHGDITVSIVVCHKPGKVVTTFEGGDFVFHYELQPNKSYQLKKIDVLDVNIHFYK